MPNPLRGEIWWVEWSPARGSEQAGRRPSLVVQSDAPNGNPNYPNTIVVTVSSQGRQVPSHVLISATEESGLDHDSYAKCEQIMTISKERLEENIGRVTSDEMLQVDRALKRMLNLHHS